MAELMCLIYGMPFILIGVGAYVGTGAGGMEASYDPDKNAVPLILFITGGLWLLLLILFHIDWDWCKSNKKEKNSQSAGRKNRNFTNQVM